MPATDTTKSGMIFAPEGHKKQWLQLRLSERRLLMMAGDALAVVGSVLVALAIWAWIGQIAFDTAFILSQIHWFIVLSTLWFLLASTNDYYDFGIAADRWASIQRLILISLQMLVIYVVVFFISERDALPRLFIIYYGVTSITLQALWRLLNPALIGWASTRRRVLIVGTDWAAETIIKTLKQYADDAYEIIGIIGGTEQIGSEINGVDVLSDGTGMLPIILREGVSEIILTSSRDLPGEIFQAVMDAYERGTVITPMPILYERLTERVPVEHVGDNWAVVLPISGKSVFNPYPVLKRLFDVVMAIIALIVFLLILPFLAIAIYFDSAGNIFYSQERVGLNGRRFRIYKLRTMIPDAEAKTGAAFASPGDDRVTRVGRFLRKTRLDELPQLWNVIIGDMSWIGPRPERPIHIERLQQKIPFYRTRHTIRPGLTGWAQVRYKYGATDEDAMVKLQYDLYYIRHQSILLDLVIIIRTIGKVLRMSGQ